ncbi:MAG: hypothetical protein QGI68_08810 [Pseudomonadales bacterium]|jgi:hypothetical protein|nr:hypothetical protein [Pseudomonadales bacterium]|tara:strand:+ start:6143 stop:6382 length:240 start_codon:yes stop_codon:yes gene_type:complete
MLGQLADRLETLDGHTIAFLDCGKRGGAPILTGIEEQLAANHVFKAIHYKKTSAHSCASRKLIDQIVSTCDALVYGVIN